MSEQTDTFRDRVRTLAGETPLVVRGAVTGATAYLLAFLSTYLLVTVDGSLDAETASEAAFEESGVLQQSQEMGFGFPQPEPSTFEFVGWILYNAHFVDIVFTPEVPTPDEQGESVPESVNVLSTAGTQIPELVYYLTPVALLTAGGYVLARQADLQDHRETLKTGLSLPLGYVSLAVVGLLLVTTAASSEQDGIEATVTASPSLVLAIAATFGVSAIFGTVGLYLGRSSS